MSPPTWPWGETIGPPEEPFSEIRDPSKAKTSIVSAKKVYTLLTGTTVVRAYKSLSIVVPDKNSAGYPAAKMVVPWVISASLSPIERKGNEEGRFAPDVESVITKSP